MPNKSAKLPPGLCAVTVIDWADLKGQSTVWAVGHQVDNLSEFKERTIMSDKTYEDYAISWSVTANYVKNAPDLQMRLMLRSLLIDENYTGLTVKEKLEILRSEADRLERQHPVITAASTDLSQTKLDKNANNPS